MNVALSPLPRALVVGGTGGLVGRAVATEFAGRYRIRSLHRHPVPAEAATGVEWVPSDVGAVTDWAPLLEGVDVVVNLAWYRWGRPEEFVDLASGLLRLVDAARRRGVPRFLHLSVPSAPVELEDRLPYFVHKRRVDAALTSSGLSFRILRPTMMFGEGDVLLTVMLRLIHRYRRFPMFGDGAYHMSPIAVGDVARLLRLECAGTTTGTVDLGGPRRYRYRELTDLLFQAVGRPPKYVGVSPGNAVRVARLLQALGSRLLYGYEVTWLLSDRLGLAPATGLDRPLAAVEPFLAAEAARLD